MQEVSGDYDKKEETAKKRKGTQGSGRVRFQLSGSGGNGQRFFYGGRGLFLSTYLGRRGGCSPGEPGRRERAGVGGARSGD